MLLREAKLKRDRADREIERLSKELDALKEESENGATA